MIARWLGILVLFGWMSLGAHGESTFENDVFESAPGAEGYGSGYPVGVDTQLEAEAEPATARGTALTFFGGLGSFTASSQLTNRWLFGVFLENRLLDPLYLELEGSLGENRYATGLGSRRSYQYNGGATAKLVPRVGPIAFEVGAGALFSYFDNLVVEDFFDSSRWTLSGRLMGGVGWHVSPDIVLGVRGDALFPFAVPRNRTVVVSPADAAVRRTTVRVMGTVTWEL